MKALFRLALGLLLLAQFACSHAPKDSEAAAGSAAPAAVQPSPALPQEEAAKANADADAVAPPPAPAAKPTPPAASARLLVYHAEVRLKTHDMARAATRLDSLVRRSGGYASAATETRVDGEWRQETTIRVPPARFQGLLSGLSGLGTVEEKKLSTDDVTAEHADVAARLQAKRAIERQYTALLGRAQKIKDVLDIEEKLGEVREEIEATESRLKTLNDEVAYSTITLTLYEPITQAVPDAPVVSLGSRLVESFYGGWQLLVSLLLGLVNLWPLLILAGLGAWLWRRRRAKVRVAGVAAGKE